jgi:hypothetical protein
MSRLNIKVEQRAPMQVADHAADLAGQPYARREIRVGPGQESIQRRPAQQIHHQKTAQVVRVRGVQLWDLGMIERLQHGGLTPEQLEG